MSQPSPTSSPLSSPPDTPTVPLSPVSPSCPAHFSSLLSSNDLRSPPSGHLPNMETSSISGPTPASAIAIPAQSLKQNLLAHNDPEATEEATSPRKRPFARSQTKLAAHWSPKSAEKATKVKPTTNNLKTRLSDQPLPSLRTRLPRNRKVPDRFEIVEAKLAPKPTPTKKGTSKVFDPVFITTNSTSRLVKADVYHMLLEAPAWTSLTAEQQTTLISMLPQHTANKALLDRIQSGDTLDTRPQAFTMSNDCFRTDVAKFKEDLKNGYLAKTWQAAAEQAVVERAAGDFDAWKAEEAELWWGQKTKQNSTLK